MSSRRVAELDDQCLTVNHDPLSDPYALQVRPLCFEWLRDKGYRVEDVKAVYNAVSLKQEEDNTGYFVAEIETLDYPAEVADAVEDIVTMWTCSCAGFHYHRFPDLSENERPSQAGSCSHIDKVRRKERQAIDDENQTNLEDL